MYSIVNDMKKKKKKKLWKRLASTLAKASRRLVTAIVVSSFHRHHHRRHLHYPRPPRHNQKPLEETRNSMPEVELFDHFDDDDDDEEEGLENGMMETSSDCFTLSHLPLLGVDARAEEFINRCKEAWRLEKQKSEEEFWEMLARGA